MNKVLSTNRTLTHALTLFVAAALLLSMTFTALARPWRIAKTPDKGRNFGCATCHLKSGGGGERNPFGKDYAKHGMTAGDKYTEHLGGLDSDGDGFTNDEEFAAGTHPGNPESKPEAAGTTQK